MSSEGQVDVSGTWPTLIQGQKAMTIPASRGITPSDALDMVEQIEFEARMEARTVPPLVDLTARYEALVEYWSSPHRVVGLSSRLDQSKEFIAEQAASAKTTLERLRRAS